MGFTGNLTGASLPGQPPGAPVVDAELTARFTRGASWFYWLAGLSLVNCAIGWFGGNTRFLFGLGVTEFVNGVVAGLNAGTPVAAFIDVLICATFVAFGVMTLKQKSKPIYMLGMVVYGLDLLLCLAFGDWIFVLFHGWVIFQLFRGYQALLQLLALEQQAAPGLSAVRTE